MPAAPTFTVHARAIVLFAGGTQPQPACDPARSKAGGSVWLTENLDFRFIWSLPALTRIYSRRASQRETLIRCQILLRPRSPPQRSLKDIARGWHRTSCRWNVPEICLIRQGCSNVYMNGVSLGFLFTGNQI